MQQGCLSELLDFLNKKTCINIPKDTRTLKGTTVDIPTQSMGSGNYQYYGLKNQIQKVLLDFSDDEVPDEIQLSICTDGIPYYTVLLKKNFKGKTAKITLS